MSANISVTASFAVNTYTLTYTAGANGAISGTTPQTVNSGGSGSAVTAVANSGYHFVSWSDGVTTAARTDANVTANISVTASFAVNTASTYTLTYTAGANGTISGSTPQTVSSGGSGSAVTAVANSGYHFVSWSDGVTTASRTDANVTANISVSANFAVNTVSPPTVTSFIMPATATSLTVPIISFTATDSVGVTGYLVTQSSATPSASASGWSSTAPTSFTFSAAGNQTAYAWAKDAAGNVSAGVSDDPVITLPPTGPVVTINSPTAGSEIGSYLVAISASATDSVKVVQMKLFIDGVEKKQVNNSKLAWTWNTYSVAKGTHVIEVTAVDSANNSSTQSTTVTVEI